MLLSCFSRIWLSATPWTVAHQALLCMEFSRQEYWSRLPFPSPGDLPDPGAKPVSLKSPAQTGGLFTTSATWKTQRSLFFLNFCKVDDKSFSCLPTCSPVTSALCEGWDRTSPFSFRGWFIYLAGVLAKAQELYWFMSSKIKVQNVGLMFHLSFCHLSFWSLGSH